MRASFLINKKREEFLSYQFYTHNGYDGQSYARVFFKSILMQDASGGGGSTITQQLIKNLYGRKYHGFLSMPINKIKELIIASRMENLYSKNEILQLYFNSVPFGENIFGIESAANRFFNKNTNELNAEESAVLVGMLKANTYYNPRLNPENALRRRNIVLQLMKNEQYLNTKTADSLQKLPLTLSYKNLDLKTTAGYFSYQVKKKAVKIIDSINETRNIKHNIEADGLKIYTSIDSRMQSYAEKAMKSHMKSLQKEFDNHWKNKKLFKKHPEIIRNEAKKTALYKNLISKGLDEKSAFDEMKKRYDFIQEQKKDLLSW